VPCAALLVGSWLIYMDGGPKPVRPDPGAPWFLQRCIRRLICRWRR